MAVTLLLTCCGYRRYRCEWLTCTAIRIKVRITTVDIHVHSLRHNECVFGKWHTFDVDLHESHWCVLTYTNKLISTFSDTIKLSTNVYNEWRNLHIRFVYYEWHNVDTGTFEWHNAEVVIYKWRNVDNDEYTRKWQNVNFDAYEWRTVYIDVSAEHFMDIDGYEWQTVDIDAFTQCRDRHIWVTQCRFDAYEWHIIYISTFMSFTSLEQWMKSIDSW